MLDKLFHFFLTFLMIVLLCAPFMTKDIKIRPIIQLIVLEIAAAYGLLHTSFGLGFVQGFADLFHKLLACASDGVQFVFGVPPNNAFVFFFAVLLPIIFIAVLIGVLRWLRILPFIIKWLGFALSKVNGMPRLESFNAVSSMIVGQSENFIAIKNILPKMSERRMYALSATAMSTVSMSIVGAYMTLLKPEYVVAALLLNMLSAFVVLHLINPGDDSEEWEAEEHTSQNFFEMLGEYILDGFKVAVIVAAMLIGFIALISLLNMVFSSVFGITFQEILGYAFFPIAWVLGVPTHEALQVGSIMATKLVSNEFVAMLDLQKIQATLSPRSLGIVSVFLVSFANFSSIGVIAGSVKALNEHQGNVVSRLGLKLVYGATLVSILSAAVAALVI